MIGAGAVDQGIFGRAPPVARGPFLQRGLGVLGPACIALHRIGPQGADQIPRVIETCLAQLRAEQRFHHIAEDIVAVRRAIVARLAAQADTARVRDHVIYRRNQILGELSPEPAAWDWPLEPPEICWDEVGRVDLDFEASWGTLGSEPLTSFGNVDVNSYVVDGQPLSIVSEGATAGIETQGEGAGQAVITIGNILADGTADILAIYTSPELIYDGVDDAISKITTVLSDEQSQKNALKTLVKQSTIFSTETFCQKMQQTVHKFLGSAASPVAE